MRVLATVVNPDNVEVTLTMTMPIGHWQQICESMNTEQRYWPCGKFKELVRAAIRKVSEQVYVTDREVS